MSRWLAGLNPEQTEAVRTVEGPLLVLAGAGSGKTRVITHRIAYLIERGIPAEHILGVTFTNKAADEMRTRLQRMVGRVAADVFLSTFHSLGLHILRSELTRKKKGARFVIYDAGDQMACLREIGRRMHLDRSFDLGAVLTRISAWKNDFISPDRLPDSDDPYDQAAAAFYPAYLEAMDAFAAVDFDDLICKPVAMLEASKSCRQRWADRFRYVLVDEYQDTNTAQLRLLKAIAGEHGNLCVVGDDDQSIYAWRGADVRNILQFESDFPGARRVTLMRNYRSVPPVLEVANQVIAANENRHPKQLLAHRTGGGAVRMVVLEDAEGEAAWVAESIRQAIDQHRRRLSDVAILYRSNILAAGLETALRGQRLAYRVLGGQSLFDRKEVKDLVAYLKVCFNPADNLSLRRVINWPARGIGPTTLARLVAFSEQTGLPLYQVVQQVDRVLAPGDRAGKSVSAFGLLLESYRARFRKGGDLAPIVGQLVDEIGVHEDILAGTTSGKAAERRWGAVGEFIEGLRAYCRNSGKPSLGDFLSQISLTDMDRDRQEEQQDGSRITLCTLHGAKGLEFPLVFLVGMEDGLLPHDRVLNPHASDLFGGDLSEERRLCYVGITRAMDELVITRARERAVRGRAREQAPSRFLGDVPEELLQIDDRTVPISPDLARDRLAAIRAMLNKSD